MDLTGAQSLEREGKLAEAETAYRQLLDAEPIDASAMHCLAMLLNRLGQPDPALELLEKAIVLQPKDVDLKINYAVVLGKRGMNAKAFQVLQEVLTVAPNSAIGRDNYGTALDRLHRPKEAQEAFRRAVELDPNYFEALLHLGISLRQAGDVGEAIKILNKAHALRPSDAETLRQLSALASAQGDAQQVIDLCAKLLHLPNASRFDYSNLVVSMHYNPAVTRNVLFHGAKAWAGLYAEPLTSAATPPRRDRDPSRRLRVGYISSDLREHPAGRLLAPVLAAHDREQVQSFCYADVAPGSSDALTVHLAGLAEEWREIYGLSDERVMERIEEDQIDILVELNGHFGHHRLSLLARRPAPIQISAFGYCDTTGLTGIDYRLTDARSDPVGISDEFHTEKLLRLDDCCWCYHPWDSTPDVQPPPCLKTCQVTFGSLNNPVKTSNAVAAAWAHILQKVPGSRLMLLAARGTQETVIKRFAKLGIHANRLILVGPTPRAGYLEQYHRIDVALDPFPFNGDNTTCDALWMGVPVVSVVGEAFWSRRGYSHLAALGLEKLTAQTTTQYIEIAVRLANDTLWQTDLRRQLRNRLVHSRLGDQKRYVQKLEAAYRQVWANWCRG